MSLRVWLPLNGDLHNQGLSDVTVTNNGATVNNNGKIGKCYIIPSVTDLSYSGSNLNTVSISLCCWVRFNTADISNILNSQSYTSTYKASNGNILGNNSYGGFSLQWYTNDIYTDGSFSSIKVQCYLRTSTVGAKATTSINLPLDTWNHLCAICDRTTNKCSLYLNGAFQNFFTFNTFTDATDRTFKLNYPATAGGNYYCPIIPILYNDVRIYDHALSAKEVKEIAKGLVLHYKLDDAYSETSTFLSSSITDTAYNSQGSKYGYNETSNLAKTTGFFQGKNCVKISTITADQNTQPYSYFGNLFTSNGTNSPAYKALSFDYFTTVPTTTWLNIYKLGNGTGTATWTTYSSTAGTRNGTYTNSSNAILVQPNEWNHVEVILHGTTDADAQWGYCINGPVHVSNPNYYFLFANIQLEENDHVTGYGSNMHNSSVYDSSGYNNIGTSNNISITQDTPRYTSSTTFLGSTSYIKVNENTVMAQHAQAMTINLWAKASTWAANTHFFSCTESGGFNTETGNSGYLRFPIYVCTNAEQTSYAYKYDSKEIQISALPANEWVMLTWVYDTTGTRTYINGQLHHTYTNTSYGIHFNTSARLFLGCEASGANPTTPYFNGQMSDFRMYYTALSVNDILELYNISMSIDKNGNIHARELVEV